MQGRAIGLEPRHFPFLSLRAYPRILLYPPETNHPRTASESFTAGDEMNPIPGYDQRGLKNSFDGEPAGTV